MSDGRRTGFERLREAMNRETNDMPEDGDVMDMIHKLEGAKATQVAAETRIEATLTGAAATTAASIAGLAWAVASGAGGFIVDILLGMAINEGKGLRPSAKNPNSGSPSAFWGPAWAV